MKVQVDKAALVQILQRVQSVTEKKTTMPVLSNALIQTKDEENGLNLYGTDLELSLRTHMDAQVEEPGAITVSARKLLEIVRELPQQEVILEVLPNRRLSVHAGRSHFEVATIPAEDFPHLSFHESAELVSFDAAVLRSSLSKTFYAIPTEEDPFSVAGLFFHRMESGATRFVASDGHRLAWVELPAQELEKLDIDSGIIIPRKGVQEMLRILEKETEISVGIQEDCFVFKTPDTLMSIQLLESQFPEYQLIIPDERPFALQMDLDELYHALKRMAVVTNQKWRHVKFSITQGSLELEAGDPEVGTAKESLDVDYQEEDFTIAFNIRYLLDAIQSMEGASFRFEWVDAYHGGIFLGPEDASYCALIMPMVV